MHEKRPTACLGTHLQWKHKMGSDKLFSTSWAIFHGNMAHLGVCASLLLSFHVESNREFQFRVESWKRVRDVIFMTSRSPTSRTSMRTRMTVIRIRKTVTHPVLEVLTWKLHFWQRSPTSSIFALREICSRGSWLDDQRCNSSSCQVEPELQMFRQEAQRKWLLLLEAPFWQLSFFVRTVSQF